MFIDALQYPLRRSGWATIVGGALFAVLLELLSRAPFVGLGAAVFSAGYFAAFYLDIISATMVGKEDVPDWPTFNSFMDDILSPFLRILILALISFGPAVLAVIFTKPGTTVHFIAVGPALLYGIFYFPMSILAVQAFGGLGAALPHVVLPGILKACPGYLLTIAGMAVTFLVIGATGALAAAIPYFGWFLTAAIGLYSMMVQARLIGLIYVEKQDILGWE